MVGKYFECMYWCSEKNIVTAAPDCGLEAFQNYSKKKPFFKINHGISVVVVWSDLSQQYRVGTNFIVSGPDP